MKMSEDKWYHTAIVVITQENTDLWRSPVRHDRLLDALDRLARAGVGMTTRAIAETGAATDLTLPQWRALVVAAESGRTGVRVGDLGRRLQVAAPGASRLVRRLETRGLVVVARDAPDRRAAIVRATDSGRVLWTAVTLRRRQLIADALDRVESVADAALLLAAVADALDESA
jgi:DNA-binding MarR family transcriptional regulator